MAAQSRAQMALKQQHEKEQKALDEELSLIKAMLEQNVTFTSHLLVYFSTVGS